MHIDVRFTVTLREAVHAVLLDLSAYDTLKTREDRYTAITSDRTEFEHFLASYLKSYGTGLREDLSSFRLENVPAEHLGQMTKAYWDGRASEKLTPWFAPSSLNAPQEEW